MISKLENREALIQRAGRVCAAAREVCGSSCLARPVRNISVECEGMRAFGSHLMSLYQNTAKAKGITFYVWGN